MKLSFALALLAVLLVALDAPTTDAARCVKRRGMCRRYGGVVGYCRVKTCKYKYSRGGRRSSRSCRRRCNRRRNRRQRRRCNRRCRGGHRSGRRKYKSCTYKRIPRCRFDVRDRRFGAIDDFDEFPIVDPLVPLQPIAPIKPISPLLCQEACYPSEEAATFGCDRSACFVRPCPGQPGYYRCTAGAVPRLPSENDCFGQCLLVKDFPKPCDSKFCVAQPCRSLAANTFSCVPKLVTLPPTTTTIGTGTTQPTTTTASCPNTCRTGPNGRDAFLTVLPTCPTGRGCKVIFCKVAELTKTFGYACVNLASAGTAITLTPSVTMTLTPTTTTATVADTTTSTTTTTTAGSADTTTTGAVVDTTTTTTTTAGDVDTTTTTSSTTTTTSTTTSTTTTTTSTTTSATLPTGVLSAADWRACTITSGGTKQSSNVLTDLSQTVTLSVSVTTAGVVNFGCKKDIVTITCLTDGTVRVEVEDPQAQQLTLEAMYPIDSIFVIDRDSFPQECRLSQFSPGFSEDADTRAARELQQRVAQTQDTFLFIRGRAGSPQNAILTVEPTCALSMFSTATITDGGPTTRMLSEASLNSSMSALQRQTVQNEEDRFDIDLTRGRTELDLRGEIPTELNRIESVSISMVGGNTASNTYVVRRQYSASLDGSLETAGDVSVSTPNENLAPILSSIFPGYPSLNVTPDGKTCDTGCGLPLLNFGTYFFVYPYLTVDGSRDETISATGLNADWAYPGATLTISTSGPVCAPTSVTVDRTRIDADTPTRSLVLDPLTSVPAFSTVGENTLKPDISAGGKFSLGFMFPDLTASVEDTVVIEIDDVEEGTGTGQIAAFPIPNGGLGPLVGTTDPTLCRTDQTCVQSATNTCDDTDAGAATPVEGADGAVLTVLRFFESQVTVIGGQQLGSIPRFFDTTAIPSLTAQIDCTTDGTV